MTKISSERDYYRSQWEKLHQAARVSSAGVWNGSPNDLHMGGHGGQLDLSINGVAAAAAAAAQAAQERDSVNNNYNNDLKLGTLR